MNSTPTITVEESRIAPAVALGFFIIGTLSLLAAIAILLIHPSLTIGDPYELESLSFGALVVFGFVGSFLFAAAYVISPVMAAASLFSDRMVWIHLILHAIGLGCLTVVFGGLNFLTDPTQGLLAGISILLLGTLLFIINLLITASRLNRWEPDQLTLMAALFWLGITVILSGALILNLEAFIPQGLDDPIELLQAHAPLGLVGFLWLSLLGFSLKLFSMFLVTDRKAGALSWIGWIFVNGSLMALVPILLFAGGQGLEVAVGAIAVGSLCYLIDIVRLWIAAKRPLDWALSGAFVGLLTGFALFVWLLLDAPLATTEDAVEVLREDTRVLFMVGVFGTFTITVVCLALRLIPFLVWQLRCAPLIGRHEVPTPRALQSTSGAFGVTIALFIAWAYLAAGQWTQSAIGGQIAALCLLVALFWFAWSLKPALRAFVFGVRIESPKSGAILDRDQ